MNETTFILLPSYFFLKHQEFFFLLSANKLTQYRLTVRYEHCITLTKIKQGFICQYSTTTTPERLSHQRKYRNYNNKDTIWPHQPQAHNDIKSD